MKQASAIKCLFLDIGGVLLSDGWPRNARERAAVQFGFDFEDFEARHRLVFDMHQLDRCTLDEYLDHTVFYRSRPFSRDAIHEFVLAQSTPLPDMIALAREIKDRYDVKVIAVSNEGRELNAHRIAQFKLDEIFETFVSSCYVHLLKPDPAIFRLALDVAQAPASETVYVENTPLFVEVAAAMGIRSIAHTSADATRTQLAAYGLA
jgi:putative hydrolase of the HAD superfamily